MRQNHSGSTNRSGPNDRSGSNKAPKVGAPQVNSVNSAAGQAGSGEVGKAGVPEVVERAAAQLPAAQPPAAQPPVAPHVEMPTARKPRLGSTNARYDRPGHLADAHAERLLLMSQRRTRRDEFALVFDSAAGDDLATELAEQAVTSMVGGGETWLDTVNAQVDEEEGGPFLETRADREFASGPEADDDTKGFLREALPTLSAGNSVPFEGVRRGRRP